MDNHSADLLRRTNIPVTKNSYSPAKKALTAN
jgi:hypothetical protein